ncbi:M20/M25/M40 family metallo-hydrolase [Planomonospora sp. ID82291]|uniref:M20/M25/M40 family metallo-hydrolase n=1 Tax=Planomonospora sp. ID82291 TaxID=2738136 RepID=UPI0018C41BE5|nr:M20/M25/M40 family metallo-hydrolase [Planomonospora sp. ID82291]MBG0814583.1 M20/M25/M40 family metallo-hydrolase [Planomonospora sp. ID82291]
MATDRDRRRHEDVGEGENGGDGAVHRFLREYREEFLRELGDWVRIASVSSVPEHGADLLRSANWLTGRLREIGFPSVELWQVDGGMPAVHAAWCEAPGAPTVLVYSHHDVRAVHAETWGESLPFEPQVRDGRIYGRGASDAKGQVLAHLWGLRAHLAATGRGAPPVNLKLLVEGEEEIGSPHLATLLKDHRDELAADLVVLSDTLLWSLEAPALCTGLRGMLSARLQVFGPYRDVHSGAVSGAAPNPCAELCKLVAQLYDGRGRVTLPGFYDRVVEPTAEEREQIGALPYSDADWLERTETRSVGGEDGYSVLERVWIRPAVEILSFIGGDPVGASRGAIPSVASVDMNLRLVPDQKVAEAAEQLKAWVAERIGDTVDYQLDVSLEAAQEPYRTPPGHPALAALGRAMERGFGVPVAGRMRNGGGGPADLLQSSLDAPVIFFGTGLPTDRWHDSDERAEIDALLKGAATLAFLWTELTGPAPA